MPAIARRPSLARLRRRIADIERSAFRSHPGTNECICGPLRLSLGAVHEFRTEDYRDAPAAAGLSLVLAASAARQCAKTITWIAPVREVFHAGYVYGNGLSVYGVNIESCLFVYARDVKAALWAAEEALSCASVVMLEMQHPHSLLDLTATRRLQLAAEKSGALVFLLRDGRDETASAARSRWRVAPALSADDPLDERGSGRFRWIVELEKTRAGGRGKWVLEWDHARKELIEIAPHSRGVVSSVVYRSSKENTAVA